MPDPAPLTSAESEALAKRRRGRNWMMLVVLAVLSALFYAITLVKMARP